MKRLCDRLPVVVALLLVGCFLLVVSFLLLTYYPDLVNSHLLASLIGALLALLGVLLTWAWNDHRRIKSMHFLIANELATLVEEMQRVGEMCVAIDDQGNELGPEQRNDQDELWRFCVHAEARVPMESYTAFLADLPRFGTETCRLVLSAYQSARSVRSCALRMRERRVDRHRADWARQSSMLVSLCGDAWEKAEKALNAFDVHRGPRGERG